MAVNPTTQDARSGGAAPRRYFQFLLTIAAYAVIVATILFYSRLHLLFFKPVAVLGIGIIGLSLIFAPVINLGNRQLKFLFFLFVTGVLLFVWQALFVLNTGMSGDWRTVGNYCGLFLALPFAYLLEKHGVRSVINGFYYICLGYVLLYLVLSIGVTFLDWFSYVEPRGVILQDPRRGRRIFALIGIVVCAMFSIIARRKENGFALTLILLLVSFAALLISQSRMSIIVTGAVLAVSFLPRSFALVLARVSACLFLIVGISAMIMIEGAQGLLSSIDQETLSLRMYSLNTAQETFSKHTLLGMGYPSDASLNSVYFGFLYYPEDLGVLGILATYGLIGAVWAFVSFTIIIAGMRRCLSPETSDILTPFGFAGLFVIVLTAFWPTLIIGDGSIIFSLMLALVMLFSAPDKPVRQPKP